MQHILMSNNTGYAGSLSFRIGTSAISPPITGFPDPNLNDLTNGPNPLFFFFS